MKVESVAISSLREDPNNARRHDERNLAAIKGSLKAFGQQKNIVVTADGVVVAGNGTLAAARELGWTEISVARTSLEDEQLKAFALADNRTAELATWDQEILSNTLRHLDDHGIDIAQIGFDDFDFSLPPKEGLTDPDEIPEHVEPRTKPGDLYVLGGHRVLCGDSTNVLDVDRLMGGEKAHLFLTDPPYNVGLEYGSEVDDSKSEGEHEDFARSWFGLWSALASYSIVSPGRRNMERWCRWFKSSSIGAWIKTNAINRGKISLFACWEPILFFGEKWKRERANDVFNFPVGNQPDTGDHPCPKPINLWVDLIENYSDASDLVTDSFLGSGSTLIACEKTGRRCFGMEIDPHYCDVIVERWERFTGDKATLLSV